MRYNYDGNYKTIFTTDISRGSYHKMSGSLTFYIFFQASAGAAAADVLANKEADLAESYMEEALNSGLEKIYTKIHPFR